MKRYVKATYIFAMATSKDKLEQRMESWSELIAEHLSKCAMYGDTLPNNKYNHWIEDELATWISDINDTVCKHNKKKLKARQYEDGLFGWLSDSPVEARANLHHQQILNRNAARSYPDVEVDINMIDRMTTISTAVLRVFVPMLASKNTLSKKDIEAELHKLIDPVCKGI